MYLKGQFTRHSYSQVYRPACGSSEERTQTTAIHSDYYTSSLEAICPDWKKQGVTATE